MIQTSPTQQLELFQPFPTSGARAVSFFSHGSDEYLAVPQLAEDIPNGDIGMNTGNSDVDLIIWRRTGGGLFKEWQRLPVPGGEDVEFFTIGDRRFLATASIRTGKGPYNYSAFSVIFEEVAGKFAPFQTFPTFGAKQWRYFNIDERHFLALAQGVKVPGLTSEHPGNSMVFEWDGKAFEPFQTIPSAWGYNFLHFELLGSHYLAYADFREPSILLRWDGMQFSHFQAFDATGGRAFAFWEHANESYLALADIEGDSTVYRWNGAKFAKHQALAGPGGREFALIQDGKDIYVVLVLFIQGSQKAPTTELESRIYRMENGSLVESSSFRTYGATDALAFTSRGDTFLFVCESLTKDVRFRTDSKLYRFQPAKEAAVQDVQGAGKQSPEFIDLYMAYTASPGAIGPQLTALISKSTENLPMLVATSSEIVLFPGKGREPSYINFRFNNRGFKELAAISHIGPALASIIKIAALDPTEWRTAATNLLSKVVKTQEVNSVPLWRDQLQVAAFEGREENITAMIDYTCMLTAKYLQAVLEDPRRLTPEFLREQYLEATGTELGASIPINAVMIATFFLVGLDISYRMRIWLQSQNIRWQDAMVLIVGKQGRETAGVTVSSNSIAQGIIQCSNLQLPVQRLYIAPHGPNPKLEGLKNEDLKQYEAAFRSVWNKTYAAVELGETMFAGYPGFAPQLSNRPTVTPSTLALSEMPEIRDPNDWLTLTTRMRLVLEDARQLLSGCVTDYAAEQLREHSNDIHKVVVPGLDSYQYSLASLNLTTDDHESNMSPKEPLYPPTTSYEPETLLGTPVRYFTQYINKPKMCPVAGGEVAYYEEGSVSSGTTVANIWVHGLPLDSRSWAAQRSTFASNFHNIYVDLRGYGNSSKLAPDAKNVTQIYCDDLLALIENLGLQRVNLIGFASAGHVALRFASQHAELLHRLVVLNASPCFRQRDDWPNGFSEMAINKFISVGEEGGVEALTNTVLNPSMVFKDLNPHDGARLRELLKPMSYNAGLDTISRFFTDISVDDDRGLMTHVTTPTLLIAASMGEEVPSGTAAFLRQSIPNSRLVEIPGADHFLFATKADVLNPLIEAFLHDG
ncbi:hypothetical protein RBB50_011474 [Rhinocladiella similis]